METTSCGKFNTARLGLCARLEALGHSGSDTDISCRCSVSCFPLYSAK